MNQLPRHSPHIFQGFPNAVTWPCNKFSDPQPRDLGPLSFQIQLNSFFLKWLVVKHMDWCWLYTLNSIPFFGYPIELVWKSPQRRRRGARHRSCETSGPWCPGVSKLSHAWIDVMMFPFWLMLFVVVYTHALNLGQIQRTLIFEISIFGHLNSPSWIFFLINLLNISIFPTRFTRFCCATSATSSVRVAGAASFRDRLAARFQLLRSRLWGTEGLGGGEKPDPWMVP